MSEQPEETRRQKIARIRSKRVRQDEVRTRTEEVCRMMKIGFSENEIVRTLATKWGVGPRCVREHYVSRARDQFLAIAGVTRKQARGISLDFWADRMKMFMLKEQQAEVKLRELTAREQELQERFDRGDEESSPVIAEELKRVSQFIVRVMGELGEVRNMIHSVQDRRDRIYGTYAPFKVAETDADGEDRKRTPEEIRVALVNLGVSIPSLPMEQALPVEFKHVESVEMPR